MKILTFGCFNIVHPGHFDLFKQSKELATDTYLIVAIADDRIVEDAKGECVYPLRERVAMIQGCRYVDAIDIYGQDVPDETLKAARTYKEHLELLYPYEQKIVEFHKPNILTFGDDKPITAYRHLQNRVRCLQLPRLGKEMSSTTILSRFQRQEPTLPDDYEKTI